MKYQPFDIVMLRPEHGAKVYALVGVVADQPLEPYRAVKLDRGPLNRVYHLEEEMILAKIGVLDPAALKLDPTQVEQRASLDWSLGQHFAQYMATRAPTELDCRRWAYLASLKPGDPVALHRFTRRGTYVEQHRFQQVLPSGQKYHFTAINANGTVYRWTLEALCLQDKKA